MLKREVYGLAKIVQFMAPSLLTAIAWKLIWRLPAARCTFKSLPEVPRTEPIGAQTVSTLGTASKTISAFSRRCHACAWSWRADEAPAQQTLLYLQVLRVPSGNSPLPTVIEIAHDRFFCLEQE